MAYSRSCISLVASLKSHYFPLQHQSIVNNRSDILSHSGASLMKAQFLLERVRLSACENVPDTIQEWFILWCCLTNCMIWGKVVPLAVVIALTWGEEFLIVLLMLAVIRDSHTEGINRGTSSQIEVKLYDSYIEEQLLSFSSLDRSLHEIAEVIYIQASCILCWSLQNFAILLIEL